MKPFFLLFSIFSSISAMLYPSLWKNEAKSHFYEEKYKKCKKLSIWAIKECETRSSGDEAWIWNFNPW